jgi:hypothetical protein
MMKKTNLLIMLLLIGFSVLPPSMSVLTVREWDARDIKELFKPQ